MQQLTMRKPRPFKWIEDAEARQVVMIALSEAPPPSRHAPRSARSWAVRIRRWPFAGPGAAIAEAELEPSAIATRSAES